MNESSEYICPECNKGYVETYDHCPRISRHEDGTREWFLIPRCRCSHCRRLHRALPDFMVPYKHYDTATITGVLEGEITPDTIENDGPSDSTMKRWHMWFEINRTLIEGLLRSIAHRQLGFSEKLLKCEDSLLEELKASYDRWLETIVRFIYNSGARLRPL